MSYAAAKEKHDSQLADDGPLPCGWCKHFTPRAILNQYGSRCSSCYEAYCLEPQTGPDVGDKRTDGPRAWAHVLKTREEAGERLTTPRKAMWRAAMGSEA